MRTMLAVNLDSTAPRIRRASRLVMLAGFALAVSSLIRPAGLAAQEADSTGAAADTTEVSADTARSFFSLAEIELPTPLVFGGQATISNDLYHSSGIDARRPGSAWQLSLTPQASLFRVITLDVDILLSSDESHLRQDINHVGLQPSWSWGRLHVGDFSRDYSHYILQGTRVRGGGIDLFTDWLRFSIQGGRLQRMISEGIAGAGEGPVYQRNMIAASVGVGREMGTHLNISMISAKDDISREDDRVIADTLLIDTLHVDLRPRIETRPQENVAVGLDGQLVLFQQAFTIRGSAALSLFTRDLFADSVAFGEGDVPEGAEWLSERLNPRLSTSLDYAYDVEAALALRGLRLRGGYEEVGPGYASLGLPYLINDRRSWHANAITQLWQGRLAFQGQYRAQANNLVSQKLNTVDRNTANGSVTARLTERVAATLTGIYMTVSNDSPGDSARLDTRSYAITANTALQSSIFGKPSVLSLGYSIQRTTDGNILSPVPSVTSQNVTASAQVVLSPSFSVVPSISGAVTTGDGLEKQHNILYGFRGNGRFLDGNLRTTANINHTISHGRKVSGAQFQLSYPVFLGADLSLQARHNRYTAFGSRPAFQESFVTTSISRSF